MLPPSPQAVIGHPERQALLAALACNSEAAASRVLSNRAVHGKRFSDDVLTPFFCAAIQANAWHALAAFSEYGYGPETVLKSASNGVDVRVGALVARSSVATIQSFRTSRFARGWDPWAPRQGGPDASDGMTFGTDEAFRYWKGEAEVSPVGGRPLSFRAHTLLALHVLACEAPTETQRQTAAARWNELAMDWVSVAGKTPFHTACETFLPMRHVDVGDPMNGERALTSLLDWVRRSTTVPDEPVVETALKEQRWGEIALAVKAGWPMGEGRVARGLLSAIDLAHNGEWKEAWQTVCASMAARPDAEREAAWAEIPALCKDDTGRPLTAEQLETLHGEQPQERAAWERAVTDDASLPPARTSGKRLRL